MQFDVIFSPEAKEHIRKLERYLAQRFYAANAERYVARLIRACTSLENSPYRGTKREDLGSGVRTMGFERSATIYFAIEVRQVVIVSICYGGRTFERESE
jgi:toxin ParE1/3/4